MFPGFISPCVKKLEFIKVAPIVISLKMGYKSVNPRPLFFSFKRSDNSLVPYVIAKFKTNPVELFCKKRSSNYNKGICLLVKKRWNWDSTIIAVNYLRDELPICFKAKLHLRGSSLN